MSIEKDGGALQTGQDSEDASSGSAAERLRQGIAARRDQRDEATQKEMMQVELEVRQRAEEKARVELEERLHREAEEAEARRAEAEALREEAARREAEAHARLLAEEAARHEAEAAARRAAEEQTRLEIEAQAQRAAEERARLKAEEQARREAAERERLAEEERELAALRERFRARREQRRKMLLNPVTLGVLLPVLIALALLHVIAFDGKRSEFEAAATAVLGVPVKAGSANAALFPSPRWVLNSVVMTTEDGAVSIGRVRLGVSLFGLFRGLDAVDSIHLESPQLPLATLLKAAAQHAALPANYETLSAQGLVLVGDRHGLPALNVHVTRRRGQAPVLLAQGEEADFGKASIEADAPEDQPEQWRFKFSTSRFQTPFGATVPLTNFSMSGVLMPGNVVIKEFSGGFNEGMLTGSMNLAWREGWRLTGTLDAKNIDAAKLIPGWMSEGLINGNANIVADPRAADPKTLLAHPHIVGSFVVSRGVLTGIDLDRVVQGRGMGDQYRFESLAGNLLVEEGRVALQSLRLTAGSLVAQGAATLAPDRKMSGRLTSEVKAGTINLKSSVDIGGTLAVPQYQR